MSNCDTWKLKHGFYGTRLYEIWRAMKKRCHLKTHIHYKNYGGRGIVVCDEWKNDSKTFFEWALSNGYRDDLTIDRIDNNGNYEPSNCRWVSVKTQCRNTRKNHLITYNGETRCLIEWSELTGIKHTTIDERLKRGWTVEQALTIPTLTRTERLKGKTNV